MKLLYLILIAFFTINLNAQNLYKSIKGSVSFFSETPIENIDAENKTLTALLNIKTKEMAFLVTNNGFKFDKPLMEEHFNENYIESDKYKVSSFKGKIINNSIEFTKNGTYKVKVKGILDIHGVENEREIEGELTIKDGKIIMVSEFYLVLKDHKIKVPKIVNEKIAQQIKININIALAVKK